MKVYVVWDPEFETVISVHKTEEGAIARQKKLNDKQSPPEGATFYSRYDWDEYELEE